MAGFNIREFTSHIHSNGVMRNNKFLVRMPYPIGFAGKSELTNTSRYMELWCDSVNIPGISMQTTQIRRYGYGVTETRPITPSFNRVTMTMMGDSKGANHSYFYNWMKLINNFDVRTGDMSRYSTGLIAGQKAYELAYKDEYAVDVEISVFNDASSEVAKIVLRDAYPIDLGDIQLNWNDTNDYMRIPVTLVYTDWYSLYDQKGSTESGARR